MREKLTFVFLCFLPLCSTLAEGNETPFSPADIFPRKGARSCRRLDILVRPFCASLPCPFTGKGACKAGRGLY